MLKLVLPSEKYKKSFLEDYLKHDEMQDEYGYTGIGKKEVSTKFPQFIKALKLQAKGEGLSKDMVPQTVYWLVEENKFIGKSSVRHKLTTYLKNYGGHIGYYIRPEQRGKGYGKQILRLTIKKARLLGIRNPIVACDITNLASKKVIESNKGQFLAKVKPGKNLPDKLRYKIK